MLTPPASFYIDPARLTRERDDVFVRSWQLVGRVEQLAEPGDYFTTQLGKEPLLFTNDGGTLRGFYNVCRHRAGPVAYGCGRAQRLSCRYHGWTYDLSGQLVAASEMDGTVDFDATGIRLQEFKVERFGPLVFAKLEPDSRSETFADLFTDLITRTTPLGLERMRHVTMREYPVESNWKIYIDNYLEGYHIPLVHPALNRELDYRHYVTELGAQHVLQFAPVRHETAAHYKDTSGAAYYYWLFPNTMLNIYANQLQTNVVIPIDAQRTVVRFDWFAFEPLPDPASDARWQELTHFSEQVQAEDAAICAAVHTNIGSRAYVPGPYSSKRESGVRLFHTLMHAHS